MIDFFIAAAVTGVWVGIQAMRRKAAPPVAHKPPPEPSFSLSIEGTERVKVFAGLLRSHGLPVRGVQSATRVPGPVRWVEMSAQARDCLTDCAYRGQTRGVEVSQFLTAGATIAAGESLVFVLLAEGHTPPRVHAVIGRNSLIQPFAARAL